MIRRRHYEWFECPVDADDQSAEGSEPFAVKVMVNPTFGMVRDEEVAREVWLGKPDDGRSPEAKRKSLEDYLRLISERVCDWNLKVEADDGTIIPVEAPGASTDNWHAFEVLESPQLFWLISLVRYAHVPKVTEILQGNVGTTDTSTPTESQEADSGTPPPDSQMPSGSDSPDTA